MRPTICLILFVAFVGLSIYLLAPAKPADEPGLKADYIRAQIEGALTQTPGEIPLSKLFPLEWKYICFLGGYDVAQETVEATLHTNYADLRSIRANDEVEWSILALDDDSLLAFARFAKHDEVLPRPAYQTQACYSQESATMKFIERGARIGRAIIKANHYQVSSNMLKELPSCKSQSCDIVIYGDEIK